MRSIAAGAQISVTSHFCMKSLKCSKSMLNAKSSSSSPYRESFQSSVEQPLLCASAKRCRRLEHILRPSWGGCVAPPPRFSASELHTCSRLAAGERMHACRTVPSVVVGRRLAACLPGAREIDRARTSVRRRCACVHSWPCMVRHRHHASSCAGACMATRWSSAHCIGCTG